MSENELVIKMRGGQSKIEDIDDNWGEIKLYKLKEKVGETGFIISDYQVSVDTITIETPFIRKGYGTLIIDILKGLSRLHNKPIVLYSLKESYGFYVAMGFKKLKKIHDERKKTVVVIFKTKNEPKIEEMELIWLPESMRGKKELRVEL
jgi:hypothetical protein